MPWRARHSSSRNECHAGILTASGEGTIHVDNQAAISLFDMCLAAHHPREFAHCDHFDILHAVWCHRTTIHARLKKIKAHNVEAHTLSLVEQYHTLGNEMADHAAHVAVDHVMPEFVTELQQQHQLVSTEQQLLRRVFQMHLQLQKDRQHAELTAHKQTPQQQSAAAIVQAFVDWDLPEGRFFTVAYDDDQLQHCQWGEQCARDLLQWCSLLKWPQPGDEPCGPTGVAVGVSWAELALSFMLYRRAYIAIQRCDQHGDKRMLQPGTSDSAKEHGVTLSELATAMSHLWDNVQGLVVPSLTPPLRRLRVSSMYVQGSPRWSRGWNVRPVLYAQDQVAHMVHGYQVGRHDWKLHATPIFDTDTMNDWLLSGTARERYLTSCTAHKVTRKMRKRG